MGFACCGRVWAESGKVNRSRLDLRPRAWGGVNGFPVLNAPSPTGLVCRPPTSFPRLPLASAADHRGQLFAVGAAKLDAGAVEVPLDGAHRYDQPIGDLPVA